MIKLKQNYNQFARASPVEHPARASSWPPQWTNDGHHRLAIGIIGLWRARRWRFPVPDSLDEEFLLCYWIFILYVFVGLRFFSVWPVYSVSNAILRTGSEGGGGGSKTSDSFT